MSDETRDIAVRVEAKLDTIGHQIERDIGERDALRRSLESGIRTVETIRQPIEKRIEELERVLEMEDRNGVKVSKLRETIEEMRVRARVREALIGIVVFIATASGAAVAFLYHLNHLKP